MAYAHLIKLGVSMTKLLNFPKQKNSNITWAEAMQAMIDNADEETRNKSVRNLLIISEDEHDYSFGLLNDSRIRQMLGTMECVKAYFIFALQTAADYTFPPEK